MSRLFRSQVQSKKSIFLSCIVVSILGYRSDYIVVSSFVLFSQIGGLSRHIKLCVRCITD